MGLLDNIFGSSSDPAVPGGNISNRFTCAARALPDVRLKGHSSVSEP